MSRFIGLALMYLSILSPLPILLLGWRQRRNFIWIYALVCLLCDITLTLLPSVSEAVKGWIGNFFIVSEALLLQLIFMQLIPQQRLRKGLWVAFGAATAFYVFHKVRYMGMDILRLESAAPFYILYALLSIAGFYHLLSMTVPVSLWRSPVFFLSMGLLFYASGSLCIFLFESFLEKENHHLLVDIWGLRNGLNLLKNLCFARALLLTQPNPRLCA